jgi:hypothetical protein
VDPNPDPGGPKTRGSGGSGSGFGSESATLSENIPENFVVVSLFRNGPDYRRAGVRQNYNFNIAFEMVVAVSYFKKYA